MICKQYIIILEINAKIKVFLILASGYLYFLIRQCQCQYNYTQINQIKIYFRVVYMLATINLVIITLVKILK